MSVDEVARGLLEHVEEGYLNGRDWTDFLGEFPVEAAHCLRMRKALGIKLPAELAVFADVFQGAEFEPQEESDEGLMNDDDPELDRTQLSDSEVARISRGSASALELVVREGGEAQRVILTCAAANLREASRRLLAKVDVE